MEKLLHQAILFAANGSVFQATTALDRYLMFSLFFGLSPEITKQSAAEDLCNHTHNRLNELVLQLQAEDKLDVPLECLNAALECLVDHLRVFLASAEQLYRLSLKGINDEKE